MEQGDMSNLYGPRIVTSDLLVHLDAANRKSYPGSGSTLYDLSGNNRNFTLNGSLTHSVYYFDGINNTNYPSGSSYSHRTNDFAYSFWIMWDAQSNLATLVENGSWSDALLIRYKTYAVAYVQGIAMYAEGALRGTHAFTPSNNIWYNIVIKRDSGVSYFYLNGMYQNQFNFTTDINLANPNMFIGRSQHTTNQYINGKISCFSIYTKALSEDEIRQNYNALKGRFGL